MTALVSRAAVEAAIAHLSIEAARKGAASAATAMRLEHERRAVRAAIVRSSTERSADLRDAEALCHPSYVEACNKEAKAVEADVFYRRASSNSMAVLDAWRSENSTARKADSIR